MVHENFRGLGIGRQLFPLCKTIFLARRLKIEQNEKSSTGLPILYNVTSNDRSRKFSNKHMRETAICHVHRTLDNSAVYLDCEESSCTYFNGRCFWVSISYPLNLPRSFILKLRDRYFWNIR